MIYVWTHRLLFVSKLDFRPFFPSYVNRLLTSSKTIPSENTLLGKLNTSLGMEVVASLSVLATIRQPDLIIDPQVALILVLVTGTVLMPLVQTPKCYMEPWLEVLNMTTQIRYLTVAMTLLKVRLPRITMLDSNQRWQDCYQKLVRKMNYISRHEQSNKKKLKRNSIIFFFCTFVSNWKDHS